MKKLDYLILFFIIFIGLIFRLYKFNIPLADLHSWRQADTAAVGRNFLKSGFDLLHPKYDDLSNVQSGMENPQGYRMVEFPIYNAIFAYAYKLAPVFTLEQWGRLISIFFSLITIIIIYYLVLKENNRLSAFFSSLIFAVFPFFVFFSRVILPESTAIGFTMLSIFFLYISNPKNVIRYILKVILSIFFFSIALLVKPTVIFYSIPLIYLFFKSYKWKLFKKPVFYFYFLIAFTPLFLWRNYIKNFPEGIPVNEWLLTMINTAGGLQRIFFRPAFFRWIFFERVNNLIFGGYLTIFFILGIIKKQKNYFFFSIFIGSLLYLLTFQGGNVQHEYYQFLILPTLAIFFGLGIDFLFQKKSLINQNITIILIPLLFFLSWYFSFDKVKNFYNYSQELIQEAKVLNNLTKPDDLVITDRMGDTTLLYLSERKGSPSIYKDPQELKKIGYKYLITNNQKQILLMKKDYKIIFENDKFTIFFL